MKLVKLQIGKNKHRYVNPDSVAAVDTKGLASYHEVLDPATGKKTTVADRTGQQVLVLMHSGLQFTVEEPLDDVLAKLGFKDPDKK